VCIFGRNFKSEQGSYQQLDRDMLRSRLYGLVAIPQVAQRTTVHIPPSRPPAYWFRAASEIETSGAQNAGGGHELGDLDRVQGGPLRRLSATQKKVRACARNQNVTLMVAASFQTHQLRPAPHRLFSVIEG
jgi:hypothetical protein